MDVEQLKQGSRESWGKGDYAPLSELLRPAAHALCDACAVSAGQEVLDVAAGDGNFALACAAEGASVVASDLAPVMVERGRARSEAEGCEIEWVEADAEELPFDDGRFECVGSVFGAMIAPRPDVVARELFRVVRPGNTVGMVAWVPGSVPTQTFEIGRRYADAPGDVPSPEEWGDEDVVRERFGELANSIEMERRALPWSGDSPGAFIEHLERHGPVQIAMRDRMAPDVYARMRAEMVDRIRELAGGDGPFTLDAEYLLTVARRRG
ncbi:MAG: class I SAM-dependent methyltransferase [Thermoleophilaceae bacterium]